VGRDSSRVKVAGPTQPGGRASASVQASAQPWPPQVAARPTPSAGAGGTEPPHGVSWTTAPAVADRDELGEQLTAAETAPNGMASPWHQNHKVAIFRIKISTQTCRSDRVDLTHHNKNRLILVEGPEIAVRPVASRALARGDAQ
jgi:hypothetical protein